MTPDEPFEFFLQWHLTPRCNLHCSHCYQSGFDGVELSLPEIRTVAAEAAAMLRDWESLYGIRIDPSCNVTGGEPLLRRDLAAILETLAGEGFALYLLSNGTLIDRRRADSLAALGVRGVQISIEGPQRIHDGIRGAGSYLSAVRGTGHLLEAGIPVTFNVTLSRLNAPHLEEMVAEASARGVPRIGFSRLVPSGQGAKLRDQMLGPMEVEGIYRRLHSFCVPGLEIVTGDPIASQLRSGTFAPSGCAPLGGCAAGLSGITLMPDGTILPCRRLEVPLGNIRTDSLREVWATSEVLCRLRTQELYGGRCGTCSRWSVCRGCRAVAFAVTATEYRSGDYLSEDPQCLVDSS